jgi:NAD(P)-dependent dehydrogenase (short-subunit alcohol dehydrogenase family)
MMPSMPLRNLLACLLLVTPWLPAPQALADTVLITGANSGIGLEFARQYAALGWRVIASHRHPEVPESLAKLAAAHPENVRVERMDVTDHGMIAEVAAKYRREPIDVLINNAAIVGALDHVEDQMFGKLDYALFDVFMRTNVAGPLKVSEAFLENVRSSRQKKIVAITSLAGSFQAAAVNRPGRIYYKASKAALNMAMTSVAAATRDAGIIVVSIHPGGVKVEKLARFDLPDFIEPKVSIASMIRVIDGLKPEQSGAFLNYTGERLPW